MEFMMHRPGSGQIQLIMGPMFSGKTTEMLRRLRIFKVAKRNVLVIKYHLDVRYNQDQAATHDLMTHEATPARRLYDVWEQAAQADVIAVDEGQFFPDLVPFCEALADQGKVVIVSALDGTFQRAPFGSVLDLVPLSDSVVKLTAVCMVCQSAAAFTTRLGSETSVELIGGADRYISTCRRCFNAHRDGRKDVASTSGSGGVRVHQEDAPCSPVAANSKTDRSVAATSTSGADRECRA